MPAYYPIRNKKERARIRAIARRRALVRRLRRKPRIGRAPRGMIPSIYKFKRFNTKTITFTDGTPTGWQLFSTGDVLQHTWVFSLDGINNYSQFTSLFSQYKLTGVRLQIYPSVSDVTAYRAADVSQMIMYTSKSRYGYSADNIEEVLSRQATKKQVVFRDGKPIDVYMKLNQLTQIYGNTTSTDYVPTRPKWINTDETNTQHYGLDMAFQTVSGQAIGDMPMSIKIMTTLYFQCKGVKSPTSE